MKSKQPQNKIDDQRLKQLEQQISNLDNQWKRALADYHNLEKRVEQEKASLTQYLNATLIEKILVVVDDLERAALHLKDKGLQMILHKLQDVLRSEGVEEIQTEGRIFDPNTMDCVDLVKGPDNKVIKVIQKGYLLHGRVLRPAKVNVGKGGLSS